MIFGPKDLSILCLAIFYPERIGMSSNADIFLLICFFFFTTLFSLLASCGILVPRTGMELAPPAVSAQSSNHWPTREVPLLHLLRLIWETQIQLMASFPSHLTGHQAGAQPVHTQEMLPTSECKLDFLKSLCYSVR